MSEENTQCYLCLSLAGHANGCDYYPDWAADEIQSLREELAKVQHEIYRVNCVHQEQMNEAIRMRVRVEAEAQELRGKLEFSKADLVEKVERLSKSTPYELELKAEIERQAARIAELEKLEKFQFEHAHKFAQERDAKEARIKELETIELKYNGGQSVLSKALGELADVREKLERAVDALEDIACRTNKDSGDMMAIAKKALAALPQDQARDFIHHWDQKCSGK